MDTDSGGKKVWRALLVSISLIAALLVGSRATADERDSPRGRSRVTAGSYGRVHAHVPRRIDSRNRGYYQQYRAGRIYHKPHHHRHALYRFPVVVGGAIAYQPFYYCGDALFLSASVRLPRLAISIDLHPREFFSEEVYGYYGDGDDDEDDDCDDDHHHDRHHRHHDDDDDDD